VNVFGNKGDWSESGSRFDLVLHHPSKSCDYIQGKRNVESKKRVLAHGCETLGDQERTTSRASKEADSSHNLVLSQVGRLGLHRVATTGGLVLDETQSKRTATILVTRELLDSSLCVLGSIETNDTSSSRPTVWLVLNLCLIDFSDGGEQLDEILVAGRPWKL